MRLSSRNLVFSYFLLLFLLLIISGCIQESTPSQRHSQRPEYGFRATSVYTEKYHVSLEEALESLNLSQDGSGQPLSGYTIHYIQGISVNREGNALRWVIGLKKGNSRIIFTYDSEGKSIAPWSAWFPQESVDFNIIMKPGCFFQKEQNIQRIFQENEEIFSIEIVGELYRVNIERNGRIVSESYSALLTGPCPVPEKRENGRVTAD